MADERHRIRQMWRNQKASAAGNGIPFLLSFEEWLKIWQESGHFSERGCHKGQYVMGRIKDKGPYSAKNVRVITVEQNIADSWSRTSQQRAHRKRMRALRGKKKSIYGIPGLYVKFNNHKSRAIRQGIDFEFTFEGWFQVWRDSGHLEERGPGAEQYVMARLGDEGPYKLGNVKIVTRRENIAERQFSVEGRARLAASLKKTMLEYRGRRK